MCCGSYLESLLMVANWGRGWSCACWSHLENGLEIHHPAASAQVPWDVSLPPEEPPLPAGAVAWQQQWGSFWGEELWFWLDHSPPETRKRQRQRLDVHQLYSFSSEILSGFKIQSSHPNSNSLRIHFITLIFYSYLKHQKHAPQLNQCLLPTFNTFPICCANVFL